MSHGSEGVRIPGSIRLVVRAELLVLLLKLVLNRCKAALDL